MRMKTENEHDALNNVFTKCNTLNDVVEVDNRQIAKTTTELLKETTPGNWIITFAAVVIVFIVVPIIPILVAFGVGHYANYWLDKHR